MKKLNLRSTIVAGAVLAIGLIGFSYDASAQGNSRWAHEKNRVRKAQKAQEKAAKRYYKEQAKQYRVYRGGSNSYYQTDYRGAELLRQAVNRGYQQGYRQGQMDRRYGRRDDYRDDRYYRSGTYGYQTYVERDQYQHYFREGYERGYYDGYNEEDRYGYRTRSGVWSILGSVLGSILNIRQY